MKDEFSIKRCLTVIRLHLSEQKKPLTILFAITAGLFTLISLVSSISAKSNLPVYEEEFTPYLIGGATIGTFFMIFPLYVIITGSMTFRCMKNKSGRIKMMMLPAKKSEKFVALTVIYTLLADLGFVAAWGASDLILSVLHMVRPVWTYSVFYTAIFTTPLFFKSITLGFLTLLTGQALFTLGSSIFPRRSFLLTFCSLITLGIISTILISFISASHPGLIKLILFPFFMSFGSSVTIYLAIIALIYLLAWWRFKNMQVVQRYLPN